MVVRPVLRDVLSDVLQDLSGLGEIDWNFQSVFPSQLTYDGASATTMRNAAGLNQYKPHQLLENAKLSVQTDGKPSGWTGDGAENINWTLLSDGSYEYEATTSTSRAAIKNTIALSLLEDDTDYTFPIFISEATWTGGSNQILNIAEVGGGESSVLRTTHFTGPGWYGASFRTGPAGNPTTDMQIQVGSGATANATGTMRFRHIGLLKGLLPGVTVGNPGLLTSQDPPLGKWIGTDDGDEPRYDIPRIGAHWDAGNGAYNAGWLRTPGYTVLAYPSEDAAAHTPIRFTIDSNVVLAPDGNTTADTLLETAVTDTHHWDVDAVAVDASTVYSAILWLKKENNRYAEIQIKDNGGTPVTAGAIFDFDTKAFVSSTAGVKLTELEPWPNGMFRLGVQFTTAADATQAILSVWGNTNGSSHQHSYAGNTSNGVTIFGWQVNLGGFLPYVPTVGAAVASAAETALDGVLGVLLPYINYLHTTFIVTATPLPGTLGGGGSQYLFHAISDAQPSNKPALELFQHASLSGRVSFQLILAATTKSWNPTEANTAGERHKYAITFFAAGGFSAFDAVDGVTEPAFTPESGFDKFAVGTTVSGLLGSPAFIEQLKILPVKQTQARLTAETVL